MKILLFAQQMAAFRSGVGTYSHGLAAGLAARGHSVTAVVPAGEQADIPGVEVIQVPRPTRVDPTPGGWISLGRRFAGVLRERGARFDLAHFTDAREAWAAVSSPPVPLTGMANDSYALDWLDPAYPRGLFADRAGRAAYYLLLRKAEGRTFPRLAGLLANSTPVARTVEEGYRLPPGFTRVIHYGLPEYPPSPPVPLAGDPSILFVGGNFQRKGLGVLLGAVARLGSRFPGMTVHVAGRDRNQPALEALARRLGVRDRVTFHGWQPNEQVRGMMAGAGGFAMPSLTEGFGLVYVEAMRAGIPVVATSAGGLSDVFRDGREALFVPPGDEVALAQALARVAGDPVFAASLAQAGRTRAAGLSVAAMAERTEGFFQGLLSAKVPRGAAAGKPVSPGSSNTREV